MTTVDRRRFVTAGAAAAGLALLGPGAAGCRGGGARRRTASLWFSYGGRNRQVLERMVRRFNASQKSHFIHGVFQGDYYEGLAKLRLGLAARAGPAVSHVIGEVVPYLADADVLEPLAGYPGADAIDVIAQLGQVGSWVGAERRPLVALPFNRSTPVAYLNGELFAQAGLGAPSSWTELREAARALTVRRGGRTERFGFECPIGWWFWAALVTQAGGEVVADDGTIVLGGEAGVRALRFWQQLVTEDRCMKRSAGREASANESTNSDFLSGRAAMIWNSTAFLKYLEQNARFPVVAAPLPADRRRGMHTGGTYFVILQGAAAEEKAAGWAFVRWMMQTDQVIEWATSTGYLPTTHSAVRRLEQAGYYDQHPNDRVAIDQLEFARPWPWSSDLVQISREVVQPVLEEAVLGGGDAATLLSRARSELDRARRD